MSRSRGPGDDAPIDPDGENGGEGGDDYQVGYGKPPRGSRFGYGNKMGRGRRKGSKNFATIYNQAVNAKVAVKIDGRTRKKSKREVALGQLINQAAKGDFKAIVKMIELEERYGPKAEAGSLSAEQKQRDSEALAAFMALRAGQED